VIARLREVAARIRAFLRSGALDREFDQELAAHVTMLTEEDVRRGMTEAEAGRAALIRVGGRASLHDQHRSVRGLPAVESILQDLRFARRMIVKGGAYSATAIVALALGIGANTLGFTIVNGAFLRGLPFDDADRLYVVSWQNRHGRRSNPSFEDLADWRATNRSFEPLAAYSDASVNISDDRARPETVAAARVTANAFRVLRQPLLLGRDFAARDEAAGASPVVILGYTMWKNRFGGDLAAVGKTVRVNGMPAAIVGVMPEAMRFPDNTDMWLPFAALDAAASRVGSLRVFGRLRDGIDRRAAQAEMSALAARMLSASHEPATDLIGVRVETFTERFVGGGGRRMFLTVMGAVFFVLLIACANVATLLLSRSADRTREMAVRMAIGASRWRVVRQQLVECIVLGGIGGSIGLAIAVAGSRIVDAALRSSMPYWISFSVDYVVFAYVGGICLTTALLFGLAPALYVSKTNNNNMLKEGGRGSTRSRREQWFSSTMVVAQVALTAVLLVGAGLLIESFVTLYVVDLGIDIDRVMTLRLQLPEKPYPTPASRRAFFDQLAPRLAAIPGVEAAALTTGVPPLDGGERLIEIDRGARGSGDRPVFVSTVTISPRFFDVVGVAPVRGRRFDDSDGALGAETVVINQRLADQFFSGEDPIGRRLRFTERKPVPGNPPDPWRTIVGISGRILHGSPQEAYLNAVVYIPYRQESPSAVSLLVRSALPPGTVMDAVRREVQAIDRDQPVLAIQTLAQVLAGDRWWWRIWGGMFGVLASIALVLSAVGLYAVTAYSVAQRTQEIGVRMAVGAQRWQVSWLILRRGLWQLTTGLMLGAAGTVALTRVIRFGLVDAAPSGPAAFAAVAIVLTVVSLAACLLPARRATRVDPVIALRAE
jgi:predicted permease